MRTFMALVHGQLFMLYLFLFCCSHSQSPYHPEESMTTLTIATFQCQYYTYDSPIAGTDSYHSQLASASNVALFIPHNGVTPTRIQKFIFISHKTYTEINSSNNEESRHAGDKTKWTSFGILLVIMGYVMYHHLSAIKLIVFSILMINEVSAQVYASMSCFEDSNYVNEYYGIHDNVDSKYNGYFLSGQYSVYKSSAKDRKFKWTHCQPPGATFSAVKSLTVTDSDSTWTKQCASGGAIMGGYSAVPEGDRIWRWYCGRMDSSGYELTDCATTDWLNDWNKIVNSLCANNGVIIGITSTYSDTYEDRKWKFNCCRVIHASTMDPSIAPTGEPTLDPTTDPICDPTLEPTLDPSHPTNDPTDDPTSDPTQDPSTNPSIDPTLFPTRDPTLFPTRLPTLSCPYNTFGIDSATCFDCDDEDKGYECKGQNIVTVQFGYWISARAKKSNHELMSLTDKTLNSQNYSITSLRCPPGQCCNHQLGCSYYDSMNQSITSSLLCAQGRNLSSIACSQCIDGLYELMGSNACDDCTHTNYIYLCLLILLSLVFTILILFLFSKPIDLLQRFRERKELNWKRLLIKDEHDLVKILIFKIALYFYQSLSQILFTKNITPISQFERAVLALGNFEIVSSFSGDSGFCFIGQIGSGLHTLLVSYVFYAFVAVDVLIIAILSRFYNISLYTMCYCLPCRCVDKLSSFKPFIKAGLINILLMSAGPILSVSFKLLTCISIDSSQGYYHFYDVTKACYEFIWFLGLICILFIITIFIIFWYFIRKQSVEQRETASNEYRSLVSKYTPKVWYWEFVLFCRRFIIALFTSIQTNSISSSVLATCIIILFGLQIHFRPFKYKRANYMEMLSLLTLGSIVVCLNLVTTDSGNSAQIMSVYISVLILTPLIIICSLMVRIVYRWYKISTVTVGNFNFKKESKALQNIKKRMPKAYREWFDKEIEMQIMQLQANVMINQTNMGSNQTNDNATKDLTVIDEGEHKTSGTPVVVHVARENENTIDVLPSSDDQESISSEEIP
eukprot:49372_1